MTYYGLNFKMGDLNGNKYLNVSLSGLVEIPACLLTLYFMDKWDNCDDDDDDCGSLQLLVC